MLGQVWSDYYKLGQIRTG